MNNSPFTDWKQKHLAIYCVFKERDKEDVKLTDATYEAIKDCWDNANIEITDEKGRIQFFGKRREIREFRFVYPKMDTTPDEYKIYSAEFKIEKDKRDKFYKELKLTDDEKDTVWSIIMARWWKTYKEAKQSAYGSAWRSYFRWMFKIIALELKGHKDKISSKEWIIQKWTSEFEIPEMYDNLPMYREFIK